VHVEPAPHEGVSASNGHEFEQLPFFGMWADRDEMSDSVAWIRRERENRQQLRTSFRPVGTRCL
jgi:hypothetical protein